MLRGPVQASFPSLEHFHREAGSSGHVYPFQARSTSPGLHQSSDLRLPSSIASATFWRSPYSEALRQSRAPGSKRQSNDPQPASATGHETHERERGGTKSEKGADTVKSILKNGGSEGRDSGSDTSSENARGPIRGILCKSSLSSSSRQSGSKVQKRVKFDDSVDSRSPVRMPSLRNDSDRLQSIDKACLHHHYSNHHLSAPNQHVHRPSSGALRSPKDVVQRGREEGDEEEEDQQAFLDEDKTVQILHWLKEVDHKQAREGRCPVFANNIYREG
nr:hypothetical protein BaRGS_011279 [Batillaria attramentaria]